VDQMSVDEVLEGKGYSERTCWLLVMTCPVWALGRYCASSHWLILVLY